MEDMLRKLIREEVVAALAEMEPRALVGATNSLPDETVKEVRFMDTTMAAKLVGRNRETIALALREGELHGNQRVFNGRWTIERDCLLAWAANTACKHRSLEIPKS